MLSVGVSMPMTVFEPLKSVIERGFLDFVSYFTKSNKKLILKYYNERLFINVETLQQHIQKSSSTNVFIANILSGYYTSSLHIFFLPVDRFPA